VDQVVWVRHGLALQIAEENVFNVSEKWKMFCFLSPYSHTRSCVTTIARALQMHDFARSSLLEQVQAVLQNRSFLLLLDNFEHVIEAAPQLMVLLMTVLISKILSPSRTVLQLWKEQEFYCSSSSIPELSQMPSYESFLMFASSLYFLSCNVPVL